MLINSPNISGSLTVTGNSVISGSLNVLGSITGAITGSATTASYVEYSNVANKPTLVSGSSQVTYSGLTGIPSGIVSGSSQVSFNGIVDKPTLVSGSSQVTYSGLTGIPSGIISGSAQITGFGIFATTGSNQFNGNQAITGSLTTTGQIVAQTLNVQQVTSSIVYSSGSNIFGNSVSNTQQLTGSVGVTGSLTVTTNGVELQVTNTGVNLGNALTDSHIISGSLRVNPNGLFVSGSGNVGIGTTSPSFQLDLGGSTTNNTRLRLQRGSDDTAQNALYGWNSITIQRTNVSLSSAQTDFSIIQQGSDGSRTPFYISSGGNVGIGTTSPNRLTELISSSGGVLGVSTSANGSSVLYGRIAMYSNAGSNSYIDYGGEIRSYSGAGIDYSDLRFYTAGGSTSSERMRITSGGLISAITSLSSFALRATNGTVASPNEGKALTLANQVYADSGTGMYFLNSFNDDSASWISFKTTTGANVTSERMRITSGGNTEIRSGNSLLVYNTANTRSGYLTTSANGTELSSFAGAGEPLILIAPDSIATIRFYTGGSTVGNEKMRITSGGNVGIGTSSPSYPLSVYRDVNGEGVLQVYNPNSGSSAYSAIYMGNNFRANSGGIAVFSTNFPTSASGMIVPNSLYVSANVNGGISINSEDVNASIRIGTANTERMRINSGGAIVMGNTTNYSDTRLSTVSAGTTSATYSFIAKNSTPSDLFIVRSDGLIGFPKINDFTTGNSPNTWINPSSSYGIYINTSSIRYKRDIINYDKGLTVVNQLRPVYYKGKSEVDGDKQFAGFIAEEIDELGLTEFVNYLEDGRPNSLSYPNMVVLLTKAIQELKAENDTLKSRIDTLEQA